MIFFINYGRWKNKISELFSDFPASSKFSLREVRVTTWWKTRRKDKIFIVYSAILSASVLIKQRDSAQPNITLEFGTIPYVSQNLSISKNYLFLLPSRLIRLLHKYARENLLLANIYIKDPAVTMIRRDQKIPVIWFVANIGGILGKYNISICLPRIIH